MKTIGYIGIALVGLVVFAYVIGGKAEDRQTEVAMESVKAEAARAPSTPMADSERGFCSAIDHFSEAYAAARQSGSNELVLSKLRTERRNWFRDNATGNNFTNWVGVIESLTTTGDGLAALSVRIPCAARVNIKTWNNALSDHGDKTLIPPSSPVYDALASTKKGVLVRFSGSFVKNPRDHFREASLGERGAMETPEYIFRFASVSPDHSNLGRFR